MGAMEQNSSKSPLRVIQKVLLNLKQILRLQFRGWVNFQTELAIKPLKKFSKNEIKVLKWGGIKIGGQNYNHEIKVLNKE